MAAGFDQPARPLHIIGDGAERLIEFVRQRAGHFAHGAEPCHPHQFGLQILQPLVSLLLPRRRALMLEQECRDCRAADGENQ